MSNRSLIAFSNEANNNILQVIKETLYPDASDREAMMIFQYCRAKRVDPMLKPVHLVPMSVKTNRKGSDGYPVYEMRKVIMPGIASYRIDASRTGQYAGLSEPEFGEEITEQIGSKMVTYPKWCKLTVKKLIDGQIYEFTAKEFWKENYASKSRKDPTPNEVWEKRGYGQLAKCTEAQVLRKAFPDAIGNEYTKEEMEGKAYLPIEVTEVKEDKFEDYNDEFKDALQAIEACESEDSLRAVFEQVKKLSFTKNPELKDKLVQAKDARKLKLTEQLHNQQVDIMKEFNLEIDAATGEVTA